MKGNGNISGVKRWPVNVRLCRYQGEGQERAAGFKGVF